MVNSDKVDDWNWVDALQMAMPVFTKLGVIIEDTAYYGKMYRIYNYSKTRHGTNGLYNAQDKMWWRDKDFVPRTRSPTAKIATGAAATAGWWLPWCACSPSCPKTPRTAPNTSKPAWP